MPVRPILEIAVILAVLVALAFLWGKRHARRLQHSRRIRIDRYKLKRRHAEIELEVFGSREVVDGVRDYAKTHHVSIEDAKKQGHVYLGEIVPKFNLLAYYRIGAPLASLIMHFLYRVVVERKPARDFNESARKGTVVYVINHRSNADYVLVAHMLFKFISLSYAVGEWARVWPLNHVFKWFGAYFIRRRYREPLYHAVLSTFVRTITKNGVTQGIFIEGGLSRDGAFLKPKLGMLDYIVTAKRDPEFALPLFLIPTAINYDRVLEDRNLTEELVGKEDRSTRMEKLNTTLEFLFKNLFRSFLRRFKRYGYAIVTFGQPIEVDEMIKRDPALVAGTFDERKPALQRLANRVMEEISSALPVTPVALVARILSEQSPLTDAQIETAIAAKRTSWPDRVWMLREKTPAEIWRAARNVLELRRLLHPVQQWRSDLFDGGGVPVIEDAWQWNPDELPLRDYYANSLLTFDEVSQRGWPDRPSRDGGQPVVVARNGTAPT
ncbi:MAG: 1-acyl-sn-glycerol-3-phosphate acyltransferase [Thermoanaerobaculia bacterium]